MYAGTEPLLLLNFVFVQKTPRPSFAFSCEFAAVQQEILNDKIAGMEKSDLVAPQVHMV